MTDLSTEAKLAQIIEAQVRGGWTQWRYLATMPVVVNKASVIPMCGDMAADSFPVVHILPILLDPQGLKAAYGEKQIRVYGLGQKNSAKWAGQQIFSDWFSGGPEAAIYTAFRLLLPPLLMPEDIPKQIERGTRELLDVSNTAAALFEKMSLQLLAYRTGEKRVRYKHLLVDGKGEPASPHSL